MVSCDTGSYTSAIPPSVCRAEPQPQSAVSPHPLCLLELPCEEQLLIWALGILTAGHVRVGFHHLGHPEVGYLGLAAGIQQNVVTGEVSVENVVFVQVGEGQRDVVRDAHLHVVEKRGLRAFQEAREALFHQLHKENGSAIAGVLDHPQELHDAGMLQVSQDAALVVEESGKVGGAGIVGSEENGVQDFGGAGQVVQRGFDDAAIGASSVHVHFLIAELAVKIDANVCLFRHYACVARRPNLI